MKKKGFTLVELLAVLVLIGILFVLITKNVLQSGNKMKQISEKEQEKLILSSAKSYFMERNSLKYKAKSGQIITIKYSDLQSKGYLPKTFQNVKTFKNINIDEYSVCVKHVSNKYKYVIARTIELENNVPVTVDVVEQVEKKDEQGNTLTDEDGNPILEDVIVKKYKTRSCLDTDFPSQ